MKKNILVSILIICLGQQASATPGKEEPSSFAQYRKKIGYVAAGVGVALVGGLLWSQTNNLQAGADNWMWRTILQRVAPKRLAVKDQSKEEFATTIYRANMAIRTVSIGLFGASAYLLYKGI